ncbi:hypothetical protein IU405_06055 [Polaribacter sp. BAL334]|uniref:hypothetical protein n=1 Tax=Polaribacter sp. BAL334 TaxID=1708178 RepID=UPI0018D24E1F|nr:hypothetical protein [Polaribacter sp. BAL334]MBG7611805.1 hypothetical protein [Polaribacter sp. BAL334]
MKVLTQKDPLTGEEFVPKRINQRFASAENRIKYNNKEATNLRKERAKITSPLHKNHRLLRKLMADKDRGVFSFDYLDGYGINFRIQTHSSRINGLKHPSIYEFIIISNIENKTIKIIRNGGY